MGSRTFSKGRRSDISGIQPLPSPILEDEEVLESDGASPKVHTRSSSPYASTTSSFLTHHFPKRYFILKSLTQHDLDLSVERGIWATQKHNESILDQAFRTSKEVILIFSVNKSGEFYGYARMASVILQSNRSVSWAPRTDSSPPMSSFSSSNFPSHDTLEQFGGFSHQSSEIHALPSEAQLAEGTLTLPLDERKVDPPAPANSNQERRSAPPVFDPSLHYFSHGRKEWPRDPGPRSAPVPISGKYSGVPGLGGRSRGGGVDDASNYDSSQLQPVVEEGRSDVQRNEANWGETFRVEWLRTERVPFHRTRHLRNPWNHGREIKVARDGTEVEPSVGQQLIEVLLVLLANLQRRQRVKLSSNTCTTTYAEQTFHNVFPHCSDTWDINFLFYFSRY